MSPPPRAFEEKTDNPRSSILEALSYDFTPDDCSRTALFAEFISMALFVWIGCGTAISTQAFVAFDPDTPLDNNMLLSIAMAFGWGIVVLAYSIAPISGKKVILSSHLLPPKRDAANGQKSINLTLLV